jgi:hypothetical protein
MIPLLPAAPALVLLGYLVQRSAKRTPRALLWAILVLGVLGLERLLADAPPLVRMAGMAVYAFLILKVMVGEEERTDGMEALPFGRWLEFSLLWIGMRPRLFLARRRPVPGASRLLGGGGLRMATGLLLIALARVSPAALAPAIVGAGLLLLFHFGACTVLAALWRMRGVRVDPIVREPIRSRSLKEFWSRRWNLVYSEMCAIVVFRPLEGRVGRMTSVFLVFLFSGLLHEMAISAPVKAGYGLPTLYFALHGVLVLVEEALARHGRPMRGVAGRAWTIFWVLAPLPILFHPPFVRGVLAPLAGLPRWR